MSYLDLLYTAKANLPGMLNQPGLWDSLIINRRKPHTYRIFTQYADLRLCLHKFDMCDEGEAFSHPHPWPAAFMVLKGKYKMNIAKINFVIMYQMLDKEAERMALEKVNVKTKLN